MLKKTRVIVSLILFVLIIFYFLDFAGLLPQSFSILERIQLVPALLYHSVGIIIFLVALTFLFGRLYCSSICPMGIFQDIVAWLSKRINKKKKYKYSPARTVLRWSVFGLVLITFLLGFPLLLSLLDPYSAYGRISTNLFKPVYLAGNNLLAWIFTNMGNYRFYFVEVYLYHLTSFLIALLTFFGIGYLAYRYGRLYCNTICPVGTLLGAASPFSLLKAEFDIDKCTRCGKCAMKCKSSCISIKGYKIDHSRCVVCFNCVDVCPCDAMHYTIHKSKSRIAEKAEKKETADLSKRQFLTTALLTAVAIPKAKADTVLHYLANNTPYKKEFAISPPGSISHKHLSKHCTACYLCVSKCPANIIVPSFMEYGLGGMMQPVVKFDKGFCNFDCTICSDICPNGAIRPLTKQEKHLTQIGKVVFIKDNCIVYTDETSCGACSEHCPTQAVSMVPYKNGLTIPQTNQNICVGCGGCEYVCPVRPFRAIYIEGNPIQLEAHPFEEAETKEVELDDFGF
ncbi:MAG: 4Fe-4S dicluster domain-containing protein [Odoribacter sp.]|nr:4Fe-4S dicluster domain-containing protein [Odoribacter sp.]